MPVYRSAREYLAAVQARYRQLPSYTDQGFVREGVRVRCRFQTFFKARAQFRFEFSTPHPYPPLSHIVTDTAIGGDANGAWMTRSHPRRGRTLESVQDLSMAVAGATGISSGSAHTIGELLLADVGGFSLRSLRRPRFRANREWEGLPCTVVSGLHPGGDRLTCWFGRDDLLLRRLIHKRRRGLQPSEQVRFNLRTDIELDVALFQELAPEPEPGDVAVQLQGSDAQRRSA